jgi:hypothetical protein
MSPTTIDLPGIGRVPALPDDLHPVAELAAATMTARTWAVIACPDDGPPMMVAAGLPNSLAAERVAGPAAYAWGADRVFVAYRAPDAVTVHTPDMQNRHHLLGSVTAEHVDPLPHVWYHVVRSFTGDPGQAAEHSRALHAAWRTAHGLPDDSDPADLITELLTHPRPEIVYLRTYIDVLGNPTALHACGEARRVQLSERTRTRMAATFARHAGV